MYICCAFEEQEVFVNISTHFLSSNIAILFELFIRIKISK